MKVELKINDCLVLACDSPHRLEDESQYRYNQTRAYLERLARTEAIPNDYRNHILDWLKALEGNTLPPAYPGM